MSKKELAFGGLVNVELSARYFVLDAESLSYYVSEQEDVYNPDNDAYGSVPTKNITSIVYPSKEKVLIHLLRLMWENGIKWIIDAGSFDSAKDWITALTKRTMVWKCKSIVILSRPL